MYRPVVIILAIGVLVLPAMSLYAQTLPIALDDHQRLPPREDAFTSVLALEHRGASVTPLGMQWDGADRLAGQLEEPAWPPHPAEVMVIRVTGDARRSTAVNREVFDALYNKPRTDEKAQLREAWKKTFGFDVWKPYYVVKDIEDWVKERCSVKVCGFKGRPEFKGNKFSYVFKKRF